MSICVSSTFSKYHELLHLRVGTDVVYSVDCKGYTVYALIHSKVPKKQSTVDKIVAAVDAELQKKEDMPGCFKFKTISTLFSGRVRTYSAQDKTFDEYYKAVFNMDEHGGAIGRRHNTWPGVYQYPETLVRLNDVGTTASIQASAPQREFKVSIFNDCFISVYDADSFSSPSVFWRILTRVWRRLPSNFACTSQTLLKSLSLRPS